MTSSCSHAPAASQASQEYTEKAWTVLKQRGLRQTEPRKQIIDALSELVGPTSAYELRDTLVERYKKADIVTIYRVLECLEANGLVHRLLTRPGGVVRCQLPPEDHCHHTESSHHCHHVLVCQCCDGVQELHCPGVEPLIAYAQSESGYAVKTHYLEFAGFCPQCQHSP